MDGQDPGEDRDVGVDAEADDVPRKPSVRDEDGDKDEDGDGRDTPPPPPPPPPTPPIRSDRIVDADIVTDGSVLVPLIYDDDPEYSQKMGSRDINDRVDADDEDAPAHDSGMTTSSLSSSSSSSSPAESQSRQPRQVHHAEHNEDRDGPRLKGCTAVTSLESGFGSRYQVVPGGLMGLVDVTATATATVNVKEEAHHPSTLSPPFTSPSPSPGDAITSKVVAAATAAASAATSKASKKAGKKLQKPRRSSSVQLPGPVGGDGSVQEDQGGNGRNETPRIGERGGTHCGPPRDEVGAPKTVESRHAADGQCLTADKTSSCRIDGAVSSPHRRVAAPLERSLTSDLRLQATTSDRGSKRPALTLFRRLSHKLKTGGNGIRRGRGRRGEDASASASASGSGEDRARQDISTNVGGRTVHDRQQLPLQGLTAVPGPVDQRLESDVAVNNVRAQDTPLPGESGPHLKRNGHSWVPIENREAEAATSTAAPSVTWYTSTGDTTFTPPLTCSGKSSPGTMWTTTRSGSSSPPCLDTPPGEPDSGRVVVVSAQGGGPVVRRPTSPRCPSLLGLRHLEHGPPSPSEPSELVVKALADANPAAHVVTSPTSPRRPSFLNLRPVDRGARSFNRSLELDEDDSTSVEASWRRQCRQLLLEIEDDKAFASCVQKLMEGSAASRPVELVTPDWTSMRLDWPPSESPHQDRLLCGSDTGDLMQAFFVVREFVRGERRYARLLIQGTQRLRWQIMGSSDPPVPPRRSLRVQELPKPARSISLPGKHNRSQSLSAAASPPQSVKARSALRRGWPVRLPSASSREDPHTPKKSLSLFSPAGSSTGLSYSQDTNSSAAEILILRESWLSHLRQLHMLSCDLLAVWESDPSPGGLGDAFTKREDRLCEVYGAWAGVVGSLIVAGLEKEGVLQRRATDGAYVELKRRGSLATRKGKEEEAEEDTREERLHMSDVLIMPIQRVSQYLLLFRRKWLCIPSSMLHNLIDAPPRFARLHRERDSDTIESGSSGTGCNQGC